MVDGRHHHPVLGCAVVREDREGLPADGPGADEVLQEVLDAVAAPFDATGGSRGVAGGDEPLLAGVAAGGRGDDPGPAAGRPDRDVEPLVGLVEHDGVATRIGPHSVAQDPTRAVGGVRYEVEEIRRVASPGAAPAIHVQGLEKSYKELHVLRGVDFDISRGSVFALLGSNGAGKTTVVNILSTLLKADAGTDAGTDAGSDAGGADASGDTGTPDAAPDAGSVGHSIYWGAFVNNATDRATLMPAKLTLRRNAVEPAPALPKVGSSRPFTSSFANPKRDAAGASRVPGDLPASSNEPPMKVATFAIEVFRVARAGSPASNCTRVTPDAP